MLEHFFAASRRVPDQQKFLKTDLVYWFFTPLVSPYLQVLFFVPPVVLLALIFDWKLDNIHQLFEHRDTYLAQQPLWLQMIESIILGDFIAYWVHRACHQSRLWRIHTIHHSPAFVNWMSVYRVHPINDMLIQIPPIIASYLIGLDLVGSIAYGPIFTFYAAFQHSNINWTFGKAGFVLTSPVYHRWHHTLEKEGLNKNFAPLMPVYDLIFGTYYMPKDKFPEHYGIVGETLPENFLKQLVYPFKRKISD
jgi:sterol desaturase/sphingolipid hydroxylase (fatty acid hydroxylase superfamily)